MNLQIRDKFPLIELSTTGSKARRYVKPDVMIAGGTNKPFKLGDMLDANATYNLIHEVLYGKSSKGVYCYNTLEEFQDALNSGQISDNVVYFILDEGIIYTEGTYAQFGGLSDEIMQYVTSLINASMLDVHKNIILTQEQYDALLTYERDTIYFIVESQPPVEEWTFGGTFPITLN